MYFDLTPAEIRTKFVRQLLPAEIAQMKQDREEMPEPIWQSIVSLRADSWAVELAAHPSELESMTQRTPKPKPAASKGTYDWDQTPKPRPAWIYCGPTPKPPAAQWEEFYYEEEEVYDLEEVLSESDSEPETQSRELKGLGFGF